MILREKKKYFKEIYFIIVKEDLKNNFLTQIKSKY